MKTTLHAIAALAALAAAAAEPSLLDLMDPAPLPKKTEGQRLSGTLTITGDYMQANRNTGEVLATGRVAAVSTPYRFLSERVSRSAEGIYHFGTPAQATTCTNHLDHLHWDLRGDFTYAEGRHVL